MNKNYLVIFVCIILLLFAQVVFAKSYSYGSKAFAKRVTGQDTQCFPALEVCSDNKDNDCDGKIDGQDTDCPAQPGGLPGSGRVGPSGPPAGSDAAGTGTGTGSTTGTGGASGSGSGTGSGTGTSTSSGTGSGSSSGSSSASSATQAASVPLWAKKWAQDPRGLTLSPLTNGKFQLGSDLTVKISGYDIVWSKGYRTDVKYVQETKKSGQQFDASKVWLSFDVSVKKPDNSNFPVEGGWIKISRTDTLTTTVPSVSFEANSARYNAVALYACKITGPKDDYIEYDCNGIDNKPVKVKVSGSTSDSGKGSWLLSDFEAEGFGFVLPPAPNLPGA